jgi:hypothetical protein
MGYFSNGSEGEYYEEQFCNHCIHQNDPCAVWGAHLFSNYQECNNKASILHQLIPMDDCGRNLDCKMFKRKSADGSHDEWLQREGLKDSAATYTSQQ